MSICTVCTQAINQKSPGVQCVSCLDFFHAKCVNLTKTLLEAIITQANIVWKCTRCLESADQNKNALCTGCAIIPQLVENINKLTSTIAELQKQIQANKQEVNNFNVEHIINEITNRQSRAKNVLIYQLKETELQTGQEREEEDTKKAEKIIKFLRPEINTENIKTVRLGRKNNDKVRPLKVTLNSREDALKLIWSKAKLRGSEYNVMISLDETNMQRNYYKKVKVEYDERLKNGEKVKIKYINGLPQIMKEKN